VGDTVRATVVELNAEKQKLGLSLREYNRKVQQEAMVQYIHDESSGGEKATFAELLKDKTKE
jgi:ribosomal protein S1